MSVNLKMLYVVGLVVFYTSIPIAFNIEKVIFLVSGYDKRLVFDTRDTYDDQKMIEKYYDAYKKASPAIVFCSRFILLIWIAMLIFSIVVIKKGITIPFKLDIITAIISLLLVVIIVVPILIFGKGWPPRPF